MKDFQSLKVELQRLKLYLDILKTVDNVYHNTTAIELEDKENTQKTFNPKIRTVVQRLSKE